MFLILLTTFMYSWWFIIENILKFFRDTSILNLQHYNIQETLADFANFIRELRNNEEDPIKIFLFGEDIGASYAVWTKKIYPDIIDGVIAYGPRLEAKIEFPEFYAIVGATIDVGENVICGEIFTNAMEQLSELVDAEEGDRIQEIFGLSNSLDTNDVKGVQWFRSFVFNYFSYIFVYQRWVRFISLLSIFKNIFLSANYSIHFIQVCVLRLTFNLFNGLKLKVLEKCDFLWFLIIKNWF